MERFSRFSRFSKGAFDDRKSSEKLEKSLFDDAEKLGKARLPCLSGKARELFGAFPIVIERTLI